MKKLNLAITLSLLATTAVAGFATTQAMAAPGDADRNGVTTRAEAQSHAAQMFAMMDANKDGKLDPADRAAHEAAMFAKLDTDGNGSISRAEFDAGHANRGPQGRGGSGPDGPMGGPDGHRMGGHGGKDRGHGMAMMMMHMADANKDGAVTQAEFTTAALAHFDKADANKDGQLTREERRAAHQQMRDHMGKMRGDHDGHGDHPA